MKFALKQIILISLPLVLLITNLSFADTKTVDLPDAVDTYTKAIELCPKDAMVYHNRGNAYDKLGNYERAIADFDTAIELNPLYAENYNNRGAAYKKIGNHKQAIADFDKAIALNPQYAAAYNNRGNTYGNAGDYKQAVADFDRAIEIDPKSAMSYNNRGFAYNNIGNHKQAIADYDKALELDPNLAIAYHNRGAAYDSLGNHHQAIADYNKALELRQPYAADSGIRANQKQWIADLSKAVEENKSRGLVIAMVILAAGAVLFILRCRINSFADMRDGELIELIKEAAQEGHFERISKKEMEYIYHRGFALAAHRLYDHDLIEAVNQFKSEIEKRKKEPFSTASDQALTTTSDVEKPHEIDETLYEAILGEKNCIYYLTKFKDFDWQSVDLKESWNWAAFFGGGVWTLYRKMYSWFFVFLLIAALCVIFVINGKYTLSFIVVLLPWLAFSVYADSLYHGSVKQKIAAAQLSITDKAKLLEYLQYEGGVNTWVIWLFISLSTAGILAAIIFYIAKQ